MEENKFILYKKFIEENLFDFFWNGNDYILNKFHLEIGNKQNINEILQKYFSFEIFNKEDNKMYQEGFLQSQDSVLYYTSLFDRVMNNYKIYEANNS